MKRAFILGLALAAAPALAHGQIAVLGNGVEEHAAHPGETYSGTLRLRNQGSEPADARIDLRDYSFAADGSSRFDPPGSTPRSNARWVAFSPAQVHLAPGAEATVGYTVTVPDGVAPGTSWSILMVTTIARGAPESAEPAGGRVRVGLQATLRYGTQIATTVAGPAPRVAFANAHAFAGARGKVLEFDVANAGDVAYRPELRVEVFDAAGQKVASLGSRRGLLYPGSSLRQRFELGALPPGTYQALVVADTGGDQLFGAQYRLQL
jgi:hypothetical protein